MASITDIAIALRVQLPAELHSCIDPLAAVIAELRAGRLSHAEAQEQLQSEVLAPLRTYCTRQPLTIRDEGSGTVLGGDLIIVGDISQAKGVAIGKYARAEVFELNLSFTTASRSPKSILALARSRHSLNRYADLRKGFVGRRDELSEIRTLLTELQPTGGYLLVKGIAGQGKSSVLAALIDELGSDITPAFFIRFSPGVNEQVDLLRHLVAELIMIHGLEDLTEGLLSDTAGTFTLANSLIMTLDRISHEGRQVVLVIDGLDQIKPNREIGERDLSFLPEKLPPGVVIVIGSRPDDTLKPLKVLVSQREYKLPPLSVDDFAALLEIREAFLTEYDRQRLHEALQGNAYDLAFVAGEIQRTPDAEVEALLQRVITNPLDIFAPALDRLRVDRILWKSAIRPILGCLLAATEGEPLSEDALRVILSIDTDEVSDALERLGGLLGKNEREGRVFYYLQHLRLIEYLRGTQFSTSGRIFSQPDIAQYHQRLADWCSKGEGRLETIWQDTMSNVEEQERREYARQHYVAHLAAAGAYEQLWELIDIGNYGRLKWRWEFSLRGYMRDLDIARQAVIDEVSDDTSSQMRALARLWRYSLLRCSLSFQADNYPDEFFQAMIDLGRYPEAERIAELLNNSLKKIELFCLIASAHLKNNTKAAIAMLKKAEAVANCMIRPEERTKALKSIQHVYFKAGNEEEVNRLSALIGMNWTDDNSERTNIEWSRVDQSDASYHNVDAHLSGSARFSDQQTSRDDDDSDDFFFADFWDKHYYNAEKITGNISSQAWNATWLSEQKSRQDANDNDVRTQFWGEVHQAFEEMRATEQLKSDVGLEEMRSLLFTLAETGEWDTVRKIINVNQDKSYRNWLLNDFARVLARNGKGEDALNIANTIEEKSERLWLLCDLARILTEIGNLRAACMIAQTLQDDDERSWLLCYLARRLAEKGEWKAACEMVETIPDGSWLKHEIVFELLETMESANAWEDVYRMACIIPDDRKRIETLLTLASRLSQINLGLAEDIINHVRYLVDIFSSRETRSLIQLFPIRALIYGAKWKQAREAIDTIPDIKMRSLILGSAVYGALELSKLWSPEAYSLKLEMLSDVELLSGKLVVDWLRNARELANDILEAQARADILLILADFLYKIGENDEAANSFNTAHKAINVITFDKERIDLLSDLAHGLAKVGKWKNAQEIAYTLPTKYQVKVFLLLAVTFAEAGNNDAATETFHAARQMIDTIAVDIKRGERLLDLARALIETGAHKAACNIADVLPEEKRATIALLLVRKQAEAGEWETALQIASSISIPWMYYSALYDIAIALVEIQQEDWKKARDLITEITTNEFRQDTELFVLSWKLAEMKQWADAQKTASIISSTWGRSKAFAVLGFHLAKSDKESAAQDIFDMACIMCDEIDDHWERNRAFLFIFVLAHESLKELAEKIVNKIDEVSARIEIASLFAGNDYYDAVRQAISNISNRNYQTEVFVAFVGNLARARKWKMAQLVIDDIKDEQAKARASAIVADELAVAGNFEDAFELLCYAWSRPKSLKEFLELFKIEEKKDGLQIMYESLFSPIPIWDRPEFSYQAVLKVGQPKPSRAEYWLKGLPDFSLTLAQGCEWVEVQLAQIMKAG
jgi:thioredoxin-like negative regulator of GroEL